MHDGKSRIHADVAVVFALDEEFSFLRSAVSEDLTPISLDSLQYYRFAFNTSNGKQRSGVALFLGDMGIEIAERKTRSLLEHFDPLVIANVGISGLINQDMNLCDVVVAKSSWNYIYRSKVAAPTDPNNLTFNDILFGGQSLPTSPSLCEFFKNFKYSHQDEWNRLKVAHQEFINQNLTKSKVKQLKERKLIAAKFNVYCEDVASGPFVGAAKLFKNWLQEQNRNYFALDMESYGVLSAVEANSRRIKPYTLVLRGISDPADESKKELDNTRLGAIRTGAMKNAVGMLKMLFLHFDEVVPEATEVIRVSQRVPDLAELMEKGRLLASNHFPEMVRPFVSRDPRLWLEQFNNLLSHFCKPWAIKDFPKGNLIEGTYSEVESSDNICPLQIDGPAGAGASEFLALFYLYALSKAKEDPNCAFPVFLSLPRYNVIIYDNEHSNLEEQVSLQVMEDLRPLYEAIERFPDKRYLIIVDGYSGFAKFREPIIRQLRGLVKSSRHQKVIGICLSCFDFLDEPSTTLLPHDWRPIRTLSFEELPANYLGIEKLVDAFLQTRQSREDERIRESILNTVRSERFQNIDLFTLDLSLDRFAKAKRGASTFSDLLRQRCARILSGLGVQPGSINTTISKASALAFDWEIRVAQKPVLPMDKLLGNKGWNLLHAHPIIRDYLVAWHIIDKIQAIGRFQRQKKGKSAKIKLQNLSYVYPDRINRLCKEITNRDQVTQKRIVDAASYIFGLEDMTLQAHVCYLLGRLAADQFRAPARKILKDFLINQEDKLEVESESERRRRLHLIRTVYISLTYLGDIDSSHKYINRMTRDPEWDDLNRGFHLEYYGDIEYLPEAGLLHRDSLGPCTRTFWKLYRRVRSHEHNPLFEIDVYTLLSLAQHRLDLDESPTPILPTEFRTMLLELVDELSDKERIQYPLLRQYAGIVTEAMQEGGFAAGSIIEQLYKLKCLPRRGWVARGISLPRIESVAEHTFAAMLLAQCFLPDTSSDQEYSKDAVIRMLLVHDLAEARIGDLLPREKNEVTRADERRYYENLSLSGTYKSTRGLRSVGDIWQTFEAANNINARVARDIDKLENLVQLYIYGRSHPISDFNSWRTSLMESIETELARAALVSIEQHFNK